MFLAADCFRIRIYKTTMLESKSIVPQEDRMMLQKSRGKTRDNIKKYNLSRNIINFFKKQGTNAPVCLLKEV